MKNYQKEQKIYGKIIERGIIMEIFEILSKINVNEHTEDKNGLTYLSWVWAWSEFKKQCPKADYEIIKQDDILNEGSDHRPIILTIE